jgi:membrane associated rhomboid family serine protease
MSVVFSGLLLWFIGSELEMKWGQVFYTKFLLVTSLGTGVFYYALSLGLGTEASVLSGLSGVTYGLLLAYGIIYSERMLTFMLIFPMKAKYFCLLLAGIQLYFGVFSQNSAISFAHLFAMLVAFVFLRYMSARARGWSLESAGRELHKKKMRNKLKIVPKAENPPDKADPNNPKYWQ